MKTLYNWIKTIFKRKPFVKDNPREYVNNNLWGDSILIDKADNYRKIKGHGFKPIIIFVPFVEKGDLFIVDMSSGKKAVYVFTEIRRVNDPRNMFFFKATFLKYKEE